MNPNKYISIEDSADGQFYYNVCSRNGHITSTSETYTRKHECKRTAKGYGFRIVDNTKSGKKKKV